MDIDVLGSGSSGNCYRVSDGETALLLECGLPFREIRRGLDFRVSDLAGAFVSHEHGDHSKAVRDMMQAGVDVYASAGTLATLGVRDGHRAKTVLGKYPCDVGTWRVTPFRAVHDAAEPLGFVLDSTATRERLLYSGDTCYIRPKVPGMTHVLIECNNDWRSIRDGDASYAEKRRIVRNHMSLETVKGFLRANDLSRLREVYLLHLSDRHSDEARFRAEVQALTGVPVYVAGG